MRGVSNLRIVDASVMPEITNANINAAVMLLAEKAADDIINFYQDTETTITPVSTSTARTSTNSLSTTPSSGTSVLHDTNKLFLVSVLTFITKLFK